MHKKRYLPKWNIPPHKDLFFFRETPINAWIDIDHKFKACFKEANRKLEHEVARYLQSIRRQKLEKTRFRTNDLKKDKKQKPHRIRKQIDQRFVEPTVQSKSCYTLGVTTSLSSERLWPYRTKLGDPADLKREVKDEAKKFSVSAVVQTKSRSFLGGLKQFFVCILSSQYYDTLGRPTLLMVSVILLLRYFSSFKRPVEYLDSVGSEM
ncbi:unnamed protein product [Nezara viridula]|uniref:Uncharacterized protein n=1 Tax=Nezara viridula TaxID=85310 RepID=A0A9P0HN81_NEZVI|nr:unnamed protein product [Nezara viridula]